MTDTLTPAAELAAKREPAFSGEAAAYAAARAALLAEEIELRRKHESVAAARRALPAGPVIDKDYRFVDERGAAVGLKDLFGPHDTLVTFFWMFGPERARPCPVCTNLVGGIDANAADLGQHVALKIFGRSPAPRQRAFADERGWSGVEFVQADDDYARDIGTLSPESGRLVVFKKDGDQVRLFWADEIGDGMEDPGQDPRGAPELFGPLWNLLDVTPAGRAPNWYPKLSY
jgi:predicted dithiol-disulfide oxidoreductase (DUF899 family)